MVYYTSLEKIGEMVPLASFKVILRGLIGERTFDPYIPRSLKDILEGCGVVIAIETIRGMKVVDGDKVSFFNECEKIFYKQIKSFDDILIELKGKNFDYDQRNYKAQWKFDRVATKFKETFCTEPKILSQG